MQYDRGVLRRLQLTELEILRKIDQVCRENGISYFVDSGTVLGAIRHKGFIPWDDDIDIGMLRPDYERFILLSRGGILGEDYAVCDPSVDERFAGMFAKVWKRGTKFSTDETIEAGIPQGIFVDVFPYDCVCANMKDAHKQLRRCRMWQNLSYLKHAHTIVVPHKGILGFLERLCCRIVHSLVSRLYSASHIKESFECSANMANKEAGSDFYANMMYPEGGVFPKSVLIPAKPLVFEGLEFQGPADPVAYLEILYGKTWGLLPPEGERRNHAPIELDFGDSL